MKKILEIGAGRTPYFIRYKIPWDKKDHFIGVDLDEKNIILTKEAIKEYRKNGNFCPIEPDFILSDASSLNIPNEYADEVIISNTISAPVHRNWDRDGNKLKIENSKTFEKTIKMESDKEDPFYIERKKIIQEAIRVLKNGGKLSIYTDLIIYGIHSYERILDELKNKSILVYQNDNYEALRVDALNSEKLKSSDFCCCFRAEVLPKSEVHRFIKKI